MISNNNNSNNSNYEYNNNRFSILYKNMIEFAKQMNIQNTIVFCQYANVQKYKGEKKTLNAASSIVDFQEYINNNCEIDD